MKKKKTSEEELLSFMKSNKDRRKVLAEREGFTDVAKYKEYLEMKVQLEGQSEVEVEEEKEELDININHIAVIDCSLSMRGASIKIAKEGLLEDFNNNKENNYQLIRFGSYVMGNESATVGVINKIRADLGMTALIDATVEALEYAISKANSTNKYLIKVFTDGMENRSKYNNIQRFGSLVKDAEELGITLTFIGPDSTLDELVNRYGVDESNTLGHDGTMDSIAGSFASMNINTVTYKTKAMAGEDVTGGFYKDLN